MIQQLNNCGFRLNLVFEQEKKENENSRKTKTEGRAQSLSETRSNL